MGVYTHRGGAGNGGAGGDRGVYHPPPEQGCTVHCNSSYHGLLSGGGAEVGTAPIQAMVGAARSEYPGDNGGRATAKGGGRGRRNRRENRVG